MLEESVTISNSEKSKGEKVINLTESKSKSSKKKNERKLILKSSQQITPSKPSEDNILKISDTDINEDLEESDNKAKLKTPSLVSGSKKSFRTPNSISKKPNTQRQSTASVKKIKCSSVLVNSGKISNNLSNVFEENADKNGSDEEECEPINLSVSANRNFAENNEINIEITMDESIDGKMNVSYFSDKSKERLTIYVNGKEVGNVENLIDRKQIENEQCIKKIDS